MSTSSMDPKVILALPPAALKTLPAANPPPGIQPNFAHPTSRVPVLLGISTTFLVIAVFCFCIRIYTKLAVTKRWRWDDLTCSFGFICSIVHFVFVVNGCVHGATGRHMWEVHLDRVLSQAQSLQTYVPEIMITPALGLIKSSLFIQIYLLFHPLRWVRISVWMGAIASSVFYVTVSITGFVMASPWPRESFLTGLRSSHSLEFTKFNIPTGVISILVDWYLLILPIPAVWSLQLSTAKKFGVLIVFMTGGLAAIASIVSLYYRVQLQHNFSDPTWGVGYGMLWVHIEMFAGVTASSMPTVHQFFAHQKASPTSYISTVRSTLASLMNRSTRVNLPDDNAGFTCQERTQTYISKDCESFKMSNLGSDSYENKAAKSGYPEEGSQIHLTQEILVP